MTKAGNSGSEPAIMRRPNHLKFAVREFTSSGMIVRVFSVTLSLQPVKVPPFSWAVMVTGVPLKNEMVIEDLSKGKLWTRIFPEPLTEKFRHFRQDDVLTGSGESFYFIKLTIHVRGI